MCLPVSYGGIEQVPLAENEKAVSREAPGLDVLCRREAMESGKIHPAEIQGLLIQSRGGRMSLPCTRCAAIAATDHNDIANPFAVCVVLAGKFNNVCGNCQWSGNGATCSYNNHIVQSG
jgi:hypothetical protein